MKPNAPASLPVNRERELFLAALDLDPEFRGGFLTRECGDDTTLHGRILGLLEESGDTGPFLAKPAIAAKPADKTALVTTGALTRGEKPGDLIGPYKLLEQIGEGGCGVVYMAEQQKPVRRRVALKIIKLGMDTRNVIARFEAERQALAMMEHPNIARVLDAGATETGRPFFVMELVRGVRVTEFCDTNNLKASGRMELFITICNAIQHAHQKGIIHRDIKPSNILVTLHDGKPVPKVIDFGIAKATEQRLTDKTLFTEFQSFIGTPAYMSPEQAEMSGLDIDTRTDIYSLGVLLYELLTGQTPFDPQELYDSGLDGCRKTIKETEPARPSTRLETMQGDDATRTAVMRSTEPARLVQMLRGDLDWVVMKCLEKDRTRRYASAHELAADVERYLANEPVEARPPSNWYRFQKLMRRHSGVVAASGAIAAILIGTAVISSWLAIRATSAEKITRKAQGEEKRLRERAERERSQAHLNEYVADVNLANQSLRAGNYGRAVQLLEKHLPKSGRADLRGFEWRYLRQLAEGNEHVALPKQEAPVDGLAFSPDGRLLAVALMDKIRIFDAASHTLITSLPHGAMALVFSPNGKTLLSSGRSGTRAWNTHDWTSLTVSTEGGSSLSLSADGALLLVSGRNGGQIWDTKAGKSLRQLPELGGASSLSPDGKFAVGETRGGWFVWKVSDGSRAFPLEGTQQTGPGGFQGGPAFRFGRLVLFSPDGKWIVGPQPVVSTRGDFQVRVWEPTTGKLAGLMPADTEPAGHASWISSMAFSKDGRWLVTGSVDHSAIIYDMQTRTVAGTLEGHLNEVWAVALSADGEHVASASKDGGLKIWPTRQRSSDNLIPGVSRPLAFSADSKRLAAIAPRGNLAILTLGSQEPMEQISMPGNGPRSPFGATLGITSDFLKVATPAPGGFVELIDLETHESRKIQTGSERIDQLALSADGRILVTGERDHGIQLWNLRQNTHTNLDAEFSRILLSPDGRFLACMPRPGGTQSAGIQIWDLSTRSILTTIASEQFGGFAASFSPDSKFLAIGGGDNLVHVWELATGRSVGSLAGHKQPVVSVAFSPDGRTMATSSDDSTLKLWNIASWQELLTIHRIGGPVRGLLFSPSGEMLVGGIGTGPETGGLLSFKAPLLAAPK